MLKKPAPVIKEEDEFMNAILASRKQPEKKEVLEQKPLEEIKTFKIETTAFDSDEVIVPVAPK